MIRTVITPETQNISIKLPLEYLGRQVEVIAFTIDSEIDVPTTLGKPLTYYASEKVLAKDWLTKKEDTAWQDL
jgi:hypothetical protein